VSGVIDRYHDSSGRLLALLIRGWSRHRSSQRGSLIDFLTTPNMNLQVGFLKHDKGKVIQAHEHKAASRVIVDTAEVLMVTKGSLRVDLYGDPMEVQSFQMDAGDVVVLLAGGHGFEVLEDRTEVWEVKQGPYLGEADKEKF
jgi:hypothetical protein